MKKLNAKDLFSCTVHDFNLSMDVYTVVYKINRVKRQRIQKYKRIIIRPKFRVQSARSIIGDEGFANI